MNFSRCVLACFTDNKDNQVCGSAVQFVYPGE